MDDILLGFTVTLVIAVSISLYEAQKANDRAEALETRITKLERSIPIPPLTTEEAVELMEGLD